MEIDKQEIDKQHGLCGGEMRIGDKHVFSSSTLEFIRECANMRCQTKPKDDTSQYDRRLFYDFVGVAGEIAVYEMLGLALPPIHVISNPDGNTAKYDLGDVILPDRKTTIDVKTTSSSNPQYLFVKQHKLQYVHDYYVLMQYCSHDQSCIFLGAVRGADVCQLPFSPSFQPTLSSSCPPSSVFLAPNSFAVPRMFLEDFSPTELALQNQSRIIPQTWQQWKTFFARNDLLAEQEPLFRPFLQNKELLKQVLFRMQFEFADPIGTITFGKHLDGIARHGITKRRWFSTLVAEQAGFSCM